MKPVVTKGGSAGGAEIACDLARDMDEATLREINTTVVVFRRQNLSNERHIEFSRRLGTGRKSLYVPPAHASGIESMPGDEAADLIAELDTHCARPEFLYRDKSQVGDLLMWDNASSMHLAICDYALPQRRLMHRMTVIRTVTF